MIDRTATVAQIVLAHPATAPVFQRHRIDYCCRGAVPVPTASAAAGVDAEGLWAELERAAVAAPAGPGDDVASLSTAALLARIVDRHHGYLREALPRILPLAAKVAHVHGAHEPRLVPLSAAVRDVSGMLLPHLDDEEQVLFPALLARTPDREAIARELARMLEDHLAVGAKLAELRALSGDFSTPEWGCTSYRLLMTELEALEGDVLRHVHLENHVLAPRFANARATA
jgi:regulator of cell morphogenesis and NO signaling